MYQPLSLAEANMGSATTRIFKGFREYGLRYPVEVLRNEFRRPRRSLTPAIRSAVISVMDTVKRRAGGSNPEPTDRLQYICDLDIIEISYDFATFLAGAEVERRQR